MSKSENQQNILFIEILLGHTSTQNIFLVLAFAHIQNLKILYEIWLISAFFVKFLKFPNFDPL